MKLPRVYPIVDTGTLALRGLGPAIAARALLDGGAQILQLRHKGSWTRELFDQAEQISRMCALHNAAFIVNDRADMAMLLRAGVHVGQDDIRPGDVLKVRGQAEPPTLLGLSTHNAGQLAAAADQPVDYIALGPIFSTASKTNPDPLVGVERLSAWRSLVPQPLVAIGGITRSNARAVLDAGADSVAIIGGLYAEPCTESSLRERMEEWLQLTRM